MARVYSFAELRTKMKVIRDLSNNMIQNLRDTEKYFKLLTTSDSEGYYSMAAAMDAKIASIDYIRDDITDRVGVLALTLWSREIKAYPNSATLLQSAAITIAATNNLLATFGDGNFTGIFANSDQFEIVQAENPDHLGIYTISSMSAVQIYFTPTPTTGDSIAITSINRSGTTATVVTTAIHGLITGDYAVHSGAVESSYNITAAITYINTTSYSYQVAGSPSAPATGTPIVYKAAASNTADTAIALRLYAR